MWIRNKIIGLVIVPINQQESCSNNQRITPKDQMILQGHKVRFYQLSTKPFSRFAEGIHQGNKGVIDQIIVEMLRRSEVSGVLYQYQSITNTYNSGNCIKLD